MKTPFNSQFHIPLHNCGVETSCSAKVWRRIKAKSNTWPITLPPPSQLVLHQHPLPRQPPTGGRGISNTPTRPLRTLIQKQGLPRGLHIAITINHLVPFPPGRGHSQEIATPRPFAASGQSAVQIDDFLLPGAARPRMRAGM